MCIYCRLAWFGNESCLLARKEQQEDRGAAHYWQAVNQCKIRAEAVALTYGSLSSIRNEVGYSGKFSSFFAYASSSPGSSGAAQDGSRKTLDRRNGR